MTDRLSEIEERLKAATEATAGREWSYDADQYRIISGDGADIHDGEDIASVLPASSFVAIPLGDFIAHAGGGNGGVAWLIAEVRKTWGAHNAEVDSHCETLQRHSKSVDANYRLRTERDEAIAIALSLSDALERADKVIVWEPALPRSFQDEVEALLADPRLAKIRGK